MTASPSLIVLASSLLVCSLALATTSPSDTSLPVPVTGDNSGPKYDIDLGSAEPANNNIVSPNTQDKQLLLKDSNKKTTTTNVDTVEKDSTESLPGLAIRRLWIYSDPIQPRLRPMEPWDTLMSENKPAAPVEPSHTMHPFVLLRPSPIRSILSDIFNNDDTRVDETEDSSSSDRKNVTTTGEREEESRPEVTKVDSNTDSVMMRAMDPHQLMLDLLHQVLSAARTNQSSTDFGAASPFSPMATAATTSTNSSEAKPEMKTESKEDVVEIGGEKYLRKTVVSKHVGENVMFMTKKYVLTPLNATVTDVTSAPKNETTILEKRQPDSPIQKEAQL